MKQCLQWRLKPNAEWCLHCLSSTGGLDRAGIKNTDLTVEEELVIASHADFGVEMESRIKCASAKYNRLLFTPGRYV